MIPPKPPVICFAAMVIPAVAGTVVRSAELSALLLGLTMGLAQGAGGANVAAIQEVMPNRLRGRVTALYYALMAMGLSGVPLWVR